MQKADRHTATSLSTPTLTLPFACQVKTNPIIPRIGKLYIVISKHEKSDSLLRVAATETMELFDVCEINSVQFRAYITQTRLRRMDI